LYPLSHTAMRKVYGKGVLGYSSRGGRLTRNSDDRTKQYSRPAAGAAVGVAEGAKTNDSPDLVRRSILPSLRERLRTHSVRTRRRS
jgi:hypothetical protein